jgi:hypothetical protein
MAWALALFAFGCGDPTGTLPEGQPFDAIAGYSGSPTMNPGQDCLICHCSTACAPGQADGGLASYRPWTIAGTVFPSASANVDAGLGQAQILVTDVTGKQLTLTSNAAGNFYTEEPLGDLTDIEVQSGGRRMVMQIGVVGSGALELVGSCNHCHTDQPYPGDPGLGLYGAPGRLFVPAP